MIQEFYVENYRSIKERQGISFIPHRKMNNGYEDYLLIDVTEKVRLLKLGILYGYNAAGKSNLLEAMDFLRRIVVEAPRSKDEETGFDPFLFDPDTASAPGRFSLVWYIDATKYEYTVLLNRETILSETLFYTPEVRKTKLFSRVYDEIEHVSKISFGTGCGFKSKDKIFLEGNTLENCTVLAAYRKTNVNSAQLDAVTSYVREHILPIVTPRVLLGEWSANRLMQHDDRKDFYLKLLAKADFQISDLEIVEEPYALTEGSLGKIQHEGILPQVMEGLRSRTTGERSELFFSHATTRGDFSISGEKESQGTMRYFGLGGVMHELIFSSRFIGIDEIETSLHPELVAFFIQQFLMNAAESQLFVTTHNQFLMEQDYMRNDMLWLCEKDEEGGSQYYSVQDFKLHKNISVINYYRAGKLGATPHLGSPVYGEGNQKL